MFLAVKVRNLARHFVKPTAHLPLPKSRSPRALDLAKLGFCLLLVRSCELSHARMPPGSGALPDRLPSSRRAQHSPFQVKP